MSSTFIVRTSGGFFTCWSAARPPCWFRRRPGRPPEQSRQHPLRPPEESSRSIRHPICPPEWREGFPPPGPLRPPPLFGLIFCLGTSGSHPIERGYCLGSGFVLDFYVGCSLVSPGFELPVFVCSLPCASVWFPLSCDPVSPPLT